LGEGSFKKAYTIDCDKDKAQKCFGDKLFNCNQQYDCRKSAIVITKQKKDDFYSEIDTQKKLVETPKIHKYGSCKDGNDFDDSEWDNFYVEDNYDYHYKIEEKFTMDLKSYIESEQILVLPHIYTITGSDVTRRRKFKYAFKQLFKQVDEFRKKGYGHFDIKPSNIGVNFMDNGDVKSFDFIDFEEAKLLEDPPQTFMCNASVCRGGTANYMDPNIWYTREETYIGQSVAWINEDSDVPKGSLGVIKSLEVVYGERDALEGYYVDNVLFDGTLTLDDYRAVVQFPKGSWPFKLAHLKYPMEHMDPFALGITLMETLFNDNPFQKLAKHPFVQDPGNGNSANNFKSDFKNLLPSKQHETSDEWIRRIYRGNSYTDTNRAFVFKYPITIDLLYNILQSEPVDRYSIKKILGHIFWKSDFDLEATGEEVQSWKLKKIQLEKQKIRDMEILKEQKKQKIRDMEILKEQKIRDRLILKKQKIRDTMILPLLRRYTAVDELLSRMSDKVTSLKEQAEEENEQDYDDIIKELMQYETSLVQTLASIGSVNLDVFKFNKKEDMSFRENLPDKIPKLLNQLNRLKEECYKLEAKRRNRLAKRFGYSNKGCYCVGECSWNENKWTLYSEGKKCPVEKKNCPTEYSDATTSDFCDNPKTPNVIPRNIAHQGDGFKIYEV
jgi:serine/threonine protein kinase